MRPLPLLFALTLAGSLQAAEPYPLWDGCESVADYARRVNLPTTKRWIGASVLIPAGKFVLGRPVRPGLQPSISAPLLLNPPIQHALLHHDHASDLPVRHASLAPLPERMVVDAVLLDDLPH